MMNQKDRMGRTPLLSAILADRSIDVIKRLLQEDIVDVNSRDDYGLTPLFCVAMGNLEAARCLLERKDIKHNQSERQNGEMKHVFVSETCVPKIISKTHHGEEDGRDVNHHGRDADLVSRKENVQVKVKF